MAMGMEGREGGDSGSGSGSVDADSAMPDAYYGGRKPPRPRTLADSAISYVSAATTSSMSSISRFMTTASASSASHAGGGGPPSTLSSFASSTHSSVFSSGDDADESSGGGGRTKWWTRVKSMRGNKRPRAARDREQLLLDQELYVRSILESYSSSLSSNRMSSSARFTDAAFAGVGAELSPPHGGTTLAAGTAAGMRDRGASTDELTGEEAMYLAQLETPSQFELDENELQNQRTIGVGDDEDDGEARKRRRIHRRITKEALRAKQLEKTQHRARTRRKLCLFLLCIGVTLSGFIVAAIFIANAGIDKQTAAAASSANNSTQNGSTESMEIAAGSSSTDSATAALATEAPVSLTPAPVTTLAKDNPLYESLNGTLPPRSSRSGIKLLPNSSSSSSSSSSLDTSGSAIYENHPRAEDLATSSAAQRLYTYVHCVLMSLSLWMSLVVIGMHITFRSFRTYSLPLVLELSFVQCGYWITSLLRVQFVDRDVNDIAYLFFCMAESFFNFGQISFTCAIAFNMYRSVVSYADVLMDSHSAKRRYRTYTLNVMLLSLLGSITLSLVGYRKFDKEATLENFQPCLYPTCRLILYVYYPLLAFGFSFIFYLRFKRTIGESYPMSATGRLNKVARSYLVLFFICWGSLITLTCIQSPDPKNRSDEDMQLVFFILQSIFDVLGVGTAVITLTNFHRCRKAFDFGLSLKTIDPNNIEFEEPVNILGEGTFALVLKAKWHQGVMDNSIVRTVDVAVKTFKHTQFECLDQMKEEAYLSSKLMHPCVMMTYGCYTNGSNLYIVYEFLGGGTLQDVLDANTSLPYETVLRYAHMIAMGMRFLHCLPVPIIHRYVWLRLVFVCKSVSALIPFAVTFFADLQ